ncbi:MAG TPA: phage tail tip lysozyme, partial [Jiangellaceae bacterium]|nr:phage tail tip lysozyme [Jiangellaceae bacterium]
MADEHTHPGGDTGDTSMPDNEGLYGPGTGDLGSGPDEASGTGSPNTGKALVQKGAEAGIKKATGSDVAVSGLRGAQKARNGDIFGGAQDVAASGAGAATTAALTATGFGAPVAGAAGSAATSLVQTKAFRYGLIAVAALATFALVAQVMIVASVSTLMVSAIVPSTSQAGILSQTCVDSSTPSAGPEQVVGSDIEEKAWNYLRGAGYTEKQTAGALGSLKHESHFNPFIAQSVAETPDVSSGWGMAQWTGSRHAAIRDAVIAELGDRFYIAAPSRDQVPDSMTQQDVDEMVLFQLRYIIDEL